MKKTVLWAIAAVVSMTITGPAFAGKGYGPGNGSGNHASTRNQSLTTNPVCDGTGPKGRGTGTQRPPDGRGRKFGQGLNTPQPTAQQPAEQTTPSAN